MMLSMKMMAPIRHRTGEVAMSGMDENRGLVGGKEEWGEEERGRG